MSRIPTLPLLAILLTSCSAIFAADEKYKTYDDAIRKAAPLLRDKQYAAAQEPLEAAVKLASNDGDRLKAYQALVPAYRLLPEIDKMLAAEEFVIGHTEQRAGRANASRDLASFLHQRGKVDAAIERYEARLKADPRDIAALSVLAVVYKQILRDDTRGAAMMQRLQDADQANAQKAAERNERDAQSAPQKSASYLKDAAVNWLEAGDKAKAIAAAKKALAGPPEQRSHILTFYWRDSLGDVFLKAGEPKLAAEQFQEAVNVAFSDNHRKGAEKKLAEAKAAEAKGGR
jgi:tetratricopeptide (TPR) repeat protein